MAKRAKFTLSFAPEAIEHLDRIESKYHGCQGAFEGTTGVCPLVE